MHNLKENLNRFTRKLNNGKINWKFLYTKATLEESVEAVDLLVARGFIVFHDEWNKNSSRREYAWSVIGKLGGKSDEDDICNPWYAGKTIFFKSKKYAKEFEKYLTSLDKRRTYTITDRY